MTILVDPLVLFHESDHRTFKYFYLRHVCQHLRGGRGEFPRLPSYNRFVERIPGALLAPCPASSAPAWALHRVGFVDSTSPTPLRVCHNARINGHRVMKGLAAQGKTSTGWFYGFKLPKLHPVVSDRGELLGLCFTRFTPSTPATPTTASPSVR